MHSTPADYDKFITIMFHYWYLRCTIWRNLVMLIIRTCDWLLPLRNDRLVSSAYEGRDFFLLPISWWLELLYNNLELLGKWLRCPTATCYNLISDFDDVQPIEEGRGVCKADFPTRILSWAWLWPVARRGLVGTSSLESSCHRHLQRPS